MSGLSKELKDLAQRALGLAKKHGASDAAVSVSESREVEVEWRDGQLQKMTDAATRGLGLQLFVDGRYAAVSSNDLRVDALDTFVREAVAVTRLLEVDPHRRLPEPELYAGRSEVDLQSYDPALESLTPEQRVQRVKELEDGARSVSGLDIISVTTGVSDGTSESYRVHSNGFEGERRGGAVWGSATVTLKDSDGRRPEESDYAGARFLTDLPPAYQIGVAATERARQRLGSKKLASATTTLVLEPRAAGRLIGYLMGPMSGSSLQQKRSCFEGKMEQQIASPTLTLFDDPFIKRGFGSRLFDGEGIAAKPLSIVDKGVLKNLYIDTYYARKLGIAPTTGGSSNVRVGLGSRSLAAILRDVQDGLLVTGFLGGNSNGTTGDFSLGVQGRRIKGGELAESFAEMNLSGNLLTSFLKIKETGNDPYPYSALMAPTLVLEGMSFAGM